MFDTETYEELYSLPSGPDPELFVLHPSGNPLYIANEDDNLVTVIDTESHSVVAKMPVGVEPEGMGDQPRCEMGGEHLRDDEHGAFHLTEDYKINTTCWSTSARAMRQYSDDGTLLFVSSEIGGTVSVMDIAEDGAPTLQDQDRLRRAGRAAGMAPAGGGQDHGGR